MVCSRNSVIALIAFGGLSAQAQPTFRDIALPMSQPNCPLGFAATRSPNGEVLSVLRTAGSKNDKDLLAVGAGLKRQDQASCSFVVRFDKPIAALETLYIDLRGTVFKERLTTLDWTFEVGNQRHRSLASPGRIIDASTDMYMRVAIVVPPGATKLHFALRGAANSRNAKDSAFVAVDAFDMCFFDPQHPEFCGPTAGPREAAKR